MHSGKKYRYALWLNEMHSGKKVMNSRVRSTFILIMLLRSDRKLWPTKGHSTPDLTEATCLKKEEERKEGRKEGKKEEKKEKKGKKYTEQDLQYLLVLQYFA